MSQALWIPMNSSRSDTAPTTKVRAEVYAQAGWTPSAVRHTRLVGRMVCQIQSSSTGW